jgi:AbrB family looped-hinge helix DNA binding protein
MHTISVQIDKAGRLVVPRKLREAIGISEKSQLEMEQEGNTLILREKTSGVRAAKEKGIWVFDSGGGVITTEMVNQVIDQGRRERLRTILGE